MHYRADYQTRLAAMGAPVTPDTVVSSARATALYLRDHDPEIRRVLVLGGSGLERELRDLGYDVVTSGHAATRVSQEDIDGFAAAGRPDAVVVGLDPNLTYARLAVASDCIRAGAHFIATNRDPVYPTERGLRPGAGSIVIALEAATGIVPVSIGKPAPYLLEAAAHAVGREPSDAVMIGDGIATDLAAARAVRARCVLMLTGVTNRTQVDALPAGRASDRGRRRRRRARRDARPSRRGLSSRSGRRPTPAPGSRPPIRRRRHAAARGRPRRRTPRRARDGRSTTAPARSARWPRPRGGIPRTA